MEVSSKRSSKVFFLAAFLGLSVVFWMTWSGYLYTQKNIRSDTKDRFLDQVERVEERILGRLQIYIDTLYGAQALFAASQAVERDEWKIYMEKQNLLERWPGISALRFIERVPKEGESAFVESVRKDGSVTPEGYPGFKIHPAMKGEEAFAVKYVEPENGNGEFLGYNLGSEPRRLHALEEARDTGKPVATPPIELADTARSLGFLVELPIYKNGAPVDSVEHRRESLAGFVDVVLKNTEFFANVLGESGAQGLNIEAFDGEFTTGNLLYAKAPAGSGRDDSKRSLLVKEKKIDFAGRSWSFRFSEPEELGLDRTDRWLPLFVAVTGGVGSGFLFIIFFLLHRSRGRAEILAKKMIVSLEKSEQKYEALISNIPVVTRTIDETGNILFVSPNVKGVYGYTAEEILQAGEKAWAHRVHEEDRGKVIKAYSELFEQGKSFEIEYRILTKEERWVWVHDQTAGVHLRSGLRAMDGAVTDVTDRKKMEKRLSVQFDLLKILVASRALPDAAGDILKVICEQFDWDLGAMWIVNAKGELLENIKIWSASEDDFQDFIRETLATKFKSGIGIPGRVWASGDACGVRDCQVDTNFPRASAAVLSGLHGAFAFPILGGNLVLGVIEFFSRESREADGHFLHMMSTCGRQIGLFLERVQSFETSRANEEKVRLLLNSTTEAIYGVDIDGKCTFVNLSCVQMLGDDADKLIGLNMHERIHNKQSDGSPNESEHCPLLRTLSTGQSYHSDMELFWRSDGNSFPVECWTHPILRGDKIIGMVVTFLDITERKKMEAQFFQAQKMEAVGRLAGGVAHDFNNLLTVINGYAEFHLSRLSQEDLLRADLEEILKAGKRAKGLTHQLLSFSRKQMVKPSVVRPGELLLNMRKMLGRLIGENIELNISAGEPQGRVKIDDSQFEQIIVNLAVNARDAMPDGGKLFITVQRVELPRDFAEHNPGAFWGPAVRISVKDTGHGIPPEVKKHLFEPFFTTKPKGIGSGLGLATCYGLIKQMGGYILIESEVSEGTDVQLYLPLSEESPESSLQKKGSSVLPSGTETILIAEDEPAVRQLTAKILSLQGYRILAAGDGVEALSLAGAQTGSKIQLLLTDVIMPQMGGKELADRLRGKCPEIKVLFMSGYTDEAIDRSGVLQSGIEFIHKPFSPIELAQKVREVLDRNCNL